MSQHRTNQTAVHWLDKTESLIEELSVKRQKQIMSKLNQKFPAEFSEMFRAEKWGSHVCTLALELEPYERNILDLQFDDLLPWSEGFYTAPGGLGEAFAKWTANNTPDFKRIWHGGFLDYAG